MCGHTPFCAERGVATRLRPTEKVLSPSIVASDLEYFYSYLFLEIMLRGCACTRNSDSFTVCDLYSVLRRFSLTTEHSTSVWLVSRSNSAVNVCLSSTLLSLPSAVLSRQGSPKRDLSTHSVVLTFHIWLPLARAATALWGECQITYTLVFHSHTPFW